MVRDNIHLFATNINQPQQMPVVALFGSPLCEVLTIKWSNCKKTEEWAQGGRTLFRYFKNEYDSNRRQWQRIGISSAREEFWGSTFRCMLPFSDWWNLQQVTQRHSEQFKIKSAARTAVAAVPRVAPSVQSSPVVATVVTSDLDYSKAWFCLWFQPTQPPWMSAPVLSAILQPPINSELPSILPINPFSVWVNQRWFLVICSPRTLTSTDEGEDSVPKRRIFVPPYCSKASQMWIPRVLANGSVSTTSNAQSQGRADTYTLSRKLPWA